MTGTRQRDWISPVQKPCSQFSPSTSRLLSSHTRRPLAVSLSNSAEAVAASLSTLYEMKTSNWASWPTMRPTARPEKKGCASTCWAEGRSAGSADSSCDTR